MMVAVDIAPPAHMVTIAVDASRRSSSCRARHRARVTRPRLLIIRRGRWAV